MDNTTSTSNKLVLAVIGMPGSGKSEAIAYISEKGIPFVRFGQVTDEGLNEQGLTVTPENERSFRENLRQNLGMAAYAIKSKPKIDELLADHEVVALDGVYSWEEYLFLNTVYKNLVLIAIYAEPKKRYARLAQRKVRPFNAEEAKKRDIAEIEKLNKGGPIAIADYLIENNTDEIGDLYTKIDVLLKRLEIKI